ncbi:hypothetical protein NDU88_003485 [Pleurodeles waltl]|uniref:Uncharacterized protein n=1 Tax=Pleurodeles waltl TaxID=8319 RepID=A0AAV7M751_PLEWA|nr:hypothetical protein NDU88_003485 [Pleurodeles waltl]
MAMFGVTIVTLYLGVLNNQRSILWQKVKREMQRNSGELLHSLSGEIPKAETLNSPKRRFGYLGRRIGYQERGKIPSTHGRFLQSSWCREEAGYPQSMHHLKTVEKAGRMKRYKVASSRLDTLLRFCRRPEHSAVDPLAEGEEGDGEEIWQAGTFLHYPQSMHNLETVEKAGRMKRYKVASSRLATLLRFCMRPEQSAVNPLEGRNLSEVLAAVAAAVETPERQFGSTWVLC